jgi:2',3'-cyclic-nucleotide 2'-phosphodiesterase (5'-nucleotidase family)
MKLLSANLVDAKGQRLFPASTVVTAGGVKVGLIGLSPPGKLAGAEGQPALPAALAEARRLRAQEKVDVVVALAAIPYGDAMELARKAEGVDFVIQSHDNRGTGIAQRDGLATLLPSGERGREVARLELTLNGAGPFTDLGEAARAEQGLKILEANIARTKERLASTQDPTVKKALQETLAGFEARQAALRKTSGGSATGFPRTHLLSYIPLGRDVASDPALQKVVERIEPPGSAAH